MRILFLTPYFPPEVGAPQNRLYELALRLQTLGVEVEVLTAMPNYPQMRVHEEYRGKSYVKEEMSGLTVHRARTWVSPKSSIPFRLMNYFAFVFWSWRAASRRLKGDFDFVFCESPPLFMAYSAFRICKRFNAKLIFNVSDLWPESAEKMGIVTNRTLLNSAYKLEKKAYLRSALVSGQTQGIVDNIHARFPDVETHWLPNGADLQRFDPSSVTPIDLREQLGLPKDSLVYFYGGILGHAQGLELIIEAARALKDDARIHFVLMGSGPEEQKLRRLISDYGLENVSLLPPTDKDSFPRILAGVDVGVVPLKALDLFLGAIPSKIFELLAMEKPILLGVKGEAKEHFVDRAEAAEFFEPEDAESLTAGILKLAGNLSLREQMGHNGRSYVKEHFDRNITSKRFHEKLLEINPSASKHG